MSLVERALQAGSDVRSGPPAAESPEEELRELRRTQRELEFRVRELQCLSDVAHALEHSGSNLGSILRKTGEVLLRTWGGTPRVALRIELEGQSWETAQYTDRIETLRVPIFVQDQAAGAIEIGEVPAAGDVAPSTPGAALSSPGRGVPGPRPAEETRLLSAVAQRLGRTSERLRRRRLVREQEHEMRERLTHLTRVSTTGEMASSIAHEVNQPLTAIATYAQACRRLIESGDTPLSEITEVLGRISAEALRAGAIVHRLKDLVRRHETRWTECDLNALVRDVQQLAAIDARLHDVALRFELSPDLPPILADGIQVQQVVLNLIRNGIDAVEEASPPGPAVLVRTAMAGADEVCVTVEDNGCGLPAELDRKLFQPFFTTKPGGMGMGLSISRSIALAHRGRVAFTRNATRGMTFRFTLPVLES